MQRGHWGQQSARHGGLLLHAGSRQVGQFPGVCLCVCVCECVCVSVSLSVCLCMYVCARVRACVGHHKDEKMCNAATGANRVLDTVGSCCTLVADKWVYAQVCWCVCISVSLCVSVCVCPCACVCGPPQGPPQGREHVQRRHGGQPRARYGGLLVHTGSRQVGQCPGVCVFLSVCLSLCVCVRACVCVCAFVSTTTRTRTLRNAATGE